LLGVLKRRGRRPSDRCKPTVGPVVLEPTTCGFDIPDSPSTRHAPRGNSEGYDSDRKPVSSANVPAKTSGGPRRARTDDLRIKRAIWVCALARILLISCVITSQRFARGGGGSRAHADSLRTPKCSAQRGVDEMFALGWRQKHADWHVLRSRWWTVWTLSSTPPPKEVRGRIRTNPGGRDALQHHPRRRGR